MKSVVTNLKSGVVVFLVALPLCLGIALACNVPPFAGLLAGIVGGIVVTTFSGSQLSVSGPAAGLTSIVLASVLALGKFEIFTAAVLCAGVMQIILGVIRAGSIGNYVPSAVIKGMLAGIGIILIMKQIPHLVGYDKDPEGDFDFQRADGHNSFSDLVDMFDAIAPGAVLIGLISIIILVIGERPFYKNNKVLSLLPAPLLVVVFGALMNVLLSGSQTFGISPERLVNLPVINDLEDLKKTLLLPDFSMIDSPKFWGIALTLAIVASLESLLSVEAADKLSPRTPDSNSNKELVAQGIGNMTCGIIGALPVTAVIVRSSANINAGATSKLSSMIHGFLLLISVLAIPNLLMLIPNSALAAVLIMTGYKLTKVELFTQHFRKGIDQFLPFVVTIVVMLLSDLLKGVGAGLLVAIFFIIRSNIRFGFEVAKDQINGKVTYLIKLPQHISFFNKGYAIRLFNNIPANSTVIIDGSINVATDADVMEVFQDFMEDAKVKKIEVQFVKFVIP